MKRQWTVEELIDAWALFADELELVGQTKGASNQLGLALLLKWFQHEGRFPQRKQDIPKDVLKYLAQQLKISADVFSEYAWQGRTIERHRAKIRQYFGFRETNREDFERLREYLLQNMVSQQRQMKQLKESIYRQCRQWRVEPPTSGRIERIIRSAIRECDELVYKDIASRLTQKTQNQLDALLLTKKVDEETQEVIKVRSHLHELRQGTGAVKLESLLRETEKLEHIEKLELPETLFAHVNDQVVESYRQRIAVEELHEIKRHPDPVRYTLLAAYCWQRRREIIDTLVDLLLDLIRRMQIRAERKIDRIVLKEIKRVHGKGRILYNIADVAVANPEGKVRDVIYPVADKQSLQDVIDEYESTGGYEVRVRTKMRSSYGQHYRQMLPAILKALTFRSTTRYTNPLWLPCTCCKNMPIAHGASIR